MVTIDCWSRSGEMESPDVNLFQGVALVKVSRISVMCSSCSSLISASVKQTVSLQDIRSGGTL